MESEEIRLSTFTSWPGPVSPLSLAASGFHYEGPPDKVKCFSCRGIVMAWDYGDDPMQEHRKHFPACTFVNNPRRSGNISFQFGQHVKTARPCGETRARMDSSTAAHRTVNDHARLSNGHTGRTETDSLIGGCIGGDSGTVFDTPTVQAQNRPSVATSNGHRYNKQEMRYEVKRLETLHHWLFKDKINIDAIAKDGLYYTSDGDKLRCAFCEGAMINWDDDDVPSEEHRKYFAGKCPLIKGEPTNNVPINKRNEYDALNIVTERPKHQNKASEEARLRTFSDWRSDHIQSSRSLAKAGFFYTGTADQVRCFFCNLGLKNWDRTDDPWEQHKQWSDNCGFLKMQVHHTPEHQMMEMFDDMDIETENKRLKEGVHCVLCQSKTRDTVFLPCGHMITCTDCGTDVKMCPRCGTAIRGTVKSYMS